MKYYISIFLLLVSQCIFAQSKNISWLAETNYEYHLEQDGSQNFDYQIARDISELVCNSKVETIKIDRSASDVSLDKYFTETLMNLVKKGKIKAFTPDGKTQLGAKAIKELTLYSEKITIFDPNTYEEIIKTVTNDLTEKINSFKIKQHWFYNEKKQKFYSKVIGIRPILHLDDNQKKELAWIPFSNKKSRDKLDINDPNKTWIKLSTDMIAFEEIKPIIGDPKSFLESKLWQEAIDGDIEIFDTDNNTFHEESLTSKYLMNEILTSVDTIITFDPNTYEEKVQIIKNVTNYKDVIFGIRQFWFFDDDRNTLNSELIGIISYKTERDEFGSMNRLSPLYYLKFD